MLSEASKQAYGKLKGYFGADLFYVCVEACSLVGGEVVGECCRGDAREEKQEEGSSPEGGGEKEGTHGLYAMVC